MVLGLIDPAYALSGLCVGFVVGLTGVGGGALMTPILMLVFGVHPATAVGTDLLFAAATKSAGTLVHGISRSIVWHVVALLAAGSVPAAMATLWLLATLGIDTHSSGRLISVVLGAALLLAAASLLFRQKLLVRPAPGIVLPPLLRGALTILVGMAIGVLVSISSVGAGALGMPALLWLHRQYGLPRLVGTDIAHAVPLTLVAGLGHWAIGSVDGALLVSLLVGSLPAVVVGSRLAPHMAERGLRIALAVMLALVGIKLLAG